MKMYADNEFLKLFASCVITKGISRSMIYDLDRYNAYPIPNHLYDLLAERDGFSINSTLRKEDNDELMYSYIDFLTEHTLAFIVPEDQCHLYPRLNRSFYTPFDITNAIVDIKDDNSLLSLFCSDSSLSLIPNLQIRFFSDRLRFDELVSALEAVETGNFLSLQLVIPEQVFENSEHYMQLNKYKKIDILFVYNFRNKVNVPAMDLLVIPISKTIDSATHCGAISFEQFSINIPTYTESLKHNTCLNRKIAIDIDGNIKNCPSMKESYGNIKDTTLAEAIEKSGFKRLWNTTKDEIAVCRDCEFRHVCTDCRAYLETPDYIYSKPLKCGYNPYTCEWEEWSSNPLKGNAIEYYGMKDMIKNTSKK